MTATGDTENMRTVTFDSFGGPEVLRVGEASVPEPGDGQIRVRVHASGVNPIDGKIRSGSMEQMFPTLLPAILGAEFAGVVDAVGPGVTGIAIGDRVAGWPDSPNGSYAELTLASNWVSVPETLDLVQAAALPGAATTALRVLDQLGVEPGGTLVVHGASGAVGSIATQLAVREGIHVIGTSNPANLDHVGGLGATAVAYGDGMIDRIRDAAPNGVDAVLDTPGKGDLPTFIELRGGTDGIVTIADMTAGSLGVTFSMGRERDLAGVQAVLDDAAAGRIALKIAGTFEFDQAANAHALSDSGHSGGKLLLIP